MSTTTQCPECGTRFKATQAQLEAYHGMVRCGHCHAAFNAIENRSTSDASRQLDLPIVQEDLTPLHTGPGEGATLIDLTEVLPGAQPVSRPYAPVDLSGPRKAGRTWPWAVASLPLLVLALAQAAYVFRVELAAYLPGLKPGLVAACARLHCSVPLPRNVDLMSIESSNLENDPAQPSIITLTVTLRNRAPYAQEYPNLELTLTDTTDTPVGRRVLRPSEYLKAAADAQAGLAANRESNIRLAIDASGLKPAGYRLFLTY